MARKKYDFCGWVTKNNIQCSDGRIISKDAFAHCDGKTVPLTWNHDHNDPTNILGKITLENREAGVYGYGIFNDTERGQVGKHLVQHGDVTAMSIYANHLKQKASYVMHGEIREVALVLAGANPGAFIEDVDLEHAEDGESDIVIYTDEEIELSHSDEDETNEETVSKESNKEEQDMANNLSHADQEKTIQDVLDEMTEEQRTVVEALVGMAIEDAQSGDDDDEEGGEENMKHNVFDNDIMHPEATLSHSDEVNIINLAKSSGCGSLQAAISIYAENNEALAHSFEDMDALFPEYKTIGGDGAPETLHNDQGWVNVVMNKTHKSPIARVRTRQADARIENLRALGYKKGDKKKEMEAIKLMKRTTDPQTVYIKDALHRDDIVDITDFDVVEYNYNEVMRPALNEEIATAIMIGDGRDEADEYKISEEHIRSIWNDKEIYTIHKDVDIAAAKAELQGTDTSARFSENYIYAEAIIRDALYAREKFKGSGTPDFYCDPHLVNVMLLARDMNGRRIYNTVAELESALNVGKIYTAEQFAGKIRTDAEGKKHKLLGIFVNLNDYQVGCTKGGEITKFQQFDIDFNQEKMLIETRISGALVRLASALVLEEPVKAGSTPTPEVTD